MIDTISIYGNTFDVAGATDIQLFLDQATETSKGIQGKIGNLRVFVTPVNLHLSGSLPKYLKGTNAADLTPIETKQAIEKISDTLHIHLHETKITRLDVATNIVLDYPVEEYFKYLGELSRYKRQPSIESLYYLQKLKRICIYDKIKELKTKRQPIPTEWEGAHVMRYELRYLRNAGKQLGNIAPTAIHKYELQKELRGKIIETYQKINKMSRTEISLKGVTGKREWNELASICLIKELGGVAKALSKIKIMKLSGEISDRQAKSLRRDIRASEMKKIDPKNAKLLVELDAKFEILKKK